MIHMIQKITNGMTLCIDFIEMYDLAHDLVKRKELTQIMVEHGSLTKLVKLNRVTLSRVRSKSSTNCG